MRLFIFETDEVRVSEFIKLLTVATTGNSFQITRTGLRAARDFRPPEEGYNFLIIDLDNTYTYEQSDLIKFAEGIPALERAPNEGWAEAIVIGGDNQLTQVITDALEKKFYLTNWKQWGKDLFDFLEEEINKVHAASPKPSLIKRP